MKNLSSEKKSGSQGGTAPNVWLTGRIPGQPCTPYSIAELRWRSMRSGDDRVIEVHCPEDWDRLIEQIQSMRYKVSYE